MANMDPSLRLASLTDFYFGARVAADPTTPKALETVSRRAYRDLSRTLHGIAAHPDKDTLLTSTHTSLQEFVDSLEAVTSQDEFNHRHDTWCQDRIRFFNKHPHPERPGFRLAYGQAQKWINMTCKYLAVLDHPAVAGVYRFLHVPIDSIVYEEAAHPTTGIGVPHPPRGAAWSKLDRDQYRTYQHQLRENVAASSDGTLTPLDWEASAWINRHSTS